MKLMNLLKLSGDFVFGNNFCNYFKFIRLQLPLTIVIEVLRFKKVEYLQCLSKLSQS
jgi:hypothetical protein